MFFTWLQAPTHSYPFLVLHFLIFSAGCSSSHQPLLAGDPRPQCPVFLSSLSAVYPSLVSPTVISVNAICMPSSSHGQGASDGPSQATHPMPALCPHPPQTRTVCHHPRLGTELPQPQVVPAGQPGIFSSCPFSPTTHPSRQETLWAMLAESVQSLTTPLYCTVTTPARATPSLPSLPPGLQATAATLNSQPVLSRAARASFYTSWSDQLTPLLRTLPSLLRSPESKSQSARSGLRDPT